MSPMDSSKQLFLSSGKQNHPPVTSPSSSSCSGIFLSCLSYKTKAAKTLQLAVWKPPTNPYVTLNTNVESLEIVMGTG